MSSHHDEKLPLAIPTDQLKQLAASVAEELKTAGGPPATSGGGSRQRGLSEDLRLRFIDVRAALFQRGIYDPVLVRFDTASVTQAPTSDIAEQLATIAAAL
jgi:hypothetical protein